MQKRRAAKCLVALACTLAALGMTSALSHMVNYRGQPQEDLTCMQASTIVATDTVVYRNDPSTNCFGFPSLQFDAAPIEGGKPNGMTIDWSLMVDELQMQDDDRIHFHLPGFTGGHNTFGIMGPSVDAGTEGNLYTPNFASETASGDLTTTAALRADFGALVGIWGISCGTEKNLYMDRAKVDNIRTAEWDPSREMLKFVLKAQRYGPATGRSDGYTGTRSAEYPSAESLTQWVGSTATQGLAIPFSASTTDPSADKLLTNSGVPANDIGATPLTSSAAITVNDQSLRGNHLQAMEYAFEGPRDSTMAYNPSTYSHDSGIGGSTAALALTSYKNDGYIYAPGNRVCGIYVDPTKLHRAQAASKITNGLGPLPPFGGIGKNWYKLAYMRRFINSQCTGGTILDSRATRPGMNPETCSILKTSQDLAVFWQVPFDGDTERVVGYQFTTTRQMLPVAKGAKPAGYLQAPTFSYAQAKGSTTGRGSDNCIIVSLIPSVTLVSTTSKTSITIEGLMNSGSSDSDTHQLYSDSSCGSTFSTLTGSDGTATKNFQPVAGTASMGSPDSLLMNYRPFGRAALLADGRTRARAITFGTDADFTAATGRGLTANGGGSGSDGYYDDVDWHTRARTGTTSALTTGNPNNNAVTASTLKAATAMSSGKLISPTGGLVAANGKGKFDKIAGKLTVAVAPGYFLQAGELLVFSFKIQNSNVVQADQALTVSASGTYCDSDNGFCDGVADKSLNIQNVPIVSKGKLLQSSLPMFVTSTIYQSSSDPDDLTTIFVTLTTNVDLKRLDATSDAKITISGLCGFETGTDVVLYQNQKAGGLHEDGEYPEEAVRTVNDLPGLTANDASILSSTATFSGGALKITIGTNGFSAEKDYAFAFQMQTSKVANSACIPRISSSGASETVLDQAMSSTNVGLVKDPQFTTLKIGQVTTRPGVTNYLCVTLQHNYQFYTDAVVNQATGATGNYIESKITISGLTGTQAVNSAVVPLSYCPTDVAYFDDKTTQHTSTQFQPLVTDFSPKRYATFGTRGCFGDGSAASPQECIPGNPYVAGDAFDTKVAGRSWFGGVALETKDTFTWDQASGTAVLTVDAAITPQRITEPQTVKGGIPKNSEIVFALPLQNGVAASDCKAVTFQASGRIVQQATMVQTMTGKAIQDGEVYGDACALKVNEPGFLLRRIVQSSSATGDDNVITVSLRSNVDFSSVANGQVSSITISGLTGTATGSNDLAVGAPGWRFSPKFEGNEGVWVQGAGTMTLKLDAGTCVPPTVWASGSYGSTTARAPFSLGGSDSSIITTQTGATTLTDAQPGYMTGGKLATAMPSICIKAGFLYVFSFQVTNPASEQAAPQVSIEGKYRNSNNVEVVIARKAMQGPISNDADKAAMLVSNQVLTTYKIGQLIPAPGSINVICVTLTSSKDIESQPDAPLSSITFTGLTGYDASAQDLQLYENDGVTKVSASGGNPSSNNYKVGAIFSSQNTASGSASTTSGAGFVNYDGSTTGNVVLWIQGESTTASGAFNYLQKNVDHKFCFRLKNPKSEMACKDVSVVVNNKGTVSRVKAEQDVSNSVTDYRFGSTCAGYVSPPNFVIKNWRSSSNATDSTAIIHMELATNILLETGDTITVSGLTSYTKACPTPPCDVGLDVTRTAVSMLYGKPYINGVRNVAGFGASDTGASAASRKTFAKAIQSIDIDGTLDGSSKTSTFGTDASWGKLGDTEQSASTLTLTISKDAEMRPFNVATQISGQNAPSEATMYEIVMTLRNKASAVATAPMISINIGQGQTQYVSLAMNAGQTAPVVGVSRVGDGGMVVAYTPMKTIYGGESLILTLPKFTRDSNGMLFGITSSPNTAFKTYSSWQDWKSYGTDQKYARAFFTNGWAADGYSAKSGDSGQTGERWNYPNINTKVTTDADRNHDTGILVLDINDPGVGMNKNYWYAATEDSLYEGRVTRAANDGSAVTNFVEATANAASTNYVQLSTTLPASLTPVPSTTTSTGTSPFAGSAATVDYYLDNGEELKPVRAWTRINEYEFSSSLATNNFKRAVAYAPVSGSTTAPITGFVRNLNSFNSYPSPVASAIDALADNIAGTPPFKGIPSKFQPSKRDNFYKGMLMKCWVGTKAVGGRVPFVEKLGAGADGYRAQTTTQKELLPPPEQVPLSAFGKKAAASAFSDVQTDLTLLIPAGTQQAAMTTALASDANVFAKAGVSRALETRVIQASYRQIDYVPRKGGGCFVTGGAATKRVQFRTLSSSTFTAATATVASSVVSVIVFTVPDVSFTIGQQVLLPDGSVRTVKAYTALDATSAATLLVTPAITVDGPFLTTAAFAGTSWIIGLDMVTQSSSGAVGCQDEVPGYPAVVRLESPFSRPLDPDALCYIQRKADVGVYTGMTAMVGNLEYSIKQGAANIYTVGFAADAMTGPNGDPVDRAVPKSYSTEGSGFGTAGKRTTAFFVDGSGLSGQPYTIYSQLELVAKAGSKVSVGETVTITLPKALSIFPPAGGAAAMEGQVTPANTKKTIADKVKISHVLLVPLSPACSVVAGYGVASGCQDGNGKGGIFDLILSDKWPYAYSSDNLNDLNGYSMTVFGGQATVIKTMADKYSQDLPYKPLQGLNTAVTTGVFTDDAILSVVADTYSQLSGLGDMGGRAQKGVSSNVPATNVAVLSTMVATAALGGDKNANSVIETTFTVARELDLMTLTGGSLRADAHKMPKLPNAPITVTDSACGYKQTDTLAPTTLPYAVCLSLGQGEADGIGDNYLAHSQGLNVADSVGSSMADACDSGLLGCAAVTTGTGGETFVVTAVAGSPSIGTPRTVAVTSSANLAVGMTVAFFRTNAIQGAAIITAISSTTQITAAKVFPVAALTLIAGDELRVMADTPISTTNFDALSLVNRLSVTVSDTTQLRPGMHVKIFTNLFLLKAIARVDSITSAVICSMTQVSPQHVAATFTTTDIIVPLANGPRMNAEGIIIDGVQTITGAVGQEATPVYPHLLRNLYSSMGSARPVPNHGTMLGRYEDAADNLGLGAYIVVGVYNKGASDRFVHAQQGNKGTTRSALPVATDMANNLVIQRYLGTSRTTIPLASVPSGYIGGNNLNSPASGTFPAPAGQVPRYQARVAAGYAIGRFSYGVDNIMQVRSDMTSGAPATGSTIPQATMLPGNNNMDGAIAMSPSSKSVDLSFSDGLSIASVLPLAGSFGTANAVGVFSINAASASATTLTSAAATTGTTTALQYYLIVPTNEKIQIVTGAGGAGTSTVTRGVLGSTAQPVPAAALLTLLSTLSAAGDTATSLTATIALVASYVQIEQTGEIIQVTTAGTAATVVRGALGSRAMAIPAFSTVRTVVTAAGVNAGYADFDSTANEQTAGIVYAAATGATSLVNNKHPSGHSVDVTAPTTMQKIRFGLSTLPLPQVFHTAKHQAGSVGQANLLTRGTCGLQGANVVTISGPTGVNTLPVMASTTGADEMCRTIPSTQYNSGLPYSRNAYIEQGMDVYLVSSIFDSLIQRPEPMRKTALGFTEEGRSQNFPGAGAFAGGPVTVTQTSITLNGVFTRTATALTVTGVGNLLQVGDIIYFDAAGTAVEAVMATEAMLITSITSNTVINVQRGFLGSLVDATVTTENIFVRRSNGGFPGLSVSSYVGGSRPSAVSPQKHSRTVGGGVHGSDSAAARLFLRNDQLLGNIQTTGQRMPRGGPSTATGTPTAIATGHRNAKGMVLSQDSGFNPEAYNYGFDSDFRLYSVLGPFMRPAVIRDVVDTSMLSRSVQASRFPGVTTIHDYGRAEDLINSGVTINGGVAATVSLLTVAGASPLNMLKVGDYITAPTTTATSAADAFLSGEIMQVVTITSITSMTVVRGVLGTTPVALVNLGRIYVIPSEVRDNNVKYSLAPVVGTTFATAQSRATQYNTYSGADRILSFCNPMQSDLNNSPGSVIMSAITDDAVLSYSTVTSTAAVTVPSVPTHTLTGSPVFTNPLLSNKWYSTTAVVGATVVATSVNIVTATTITIGNLAMAPFVNIGDYLVATNAAGTLTHGDIMRVVAIASATTLTVVRTQFGTTAATFAGTEILYAIPRAEVSRIITQKSAADNKYASSNGKESTAPSLWTVPRRHHLCRKLVTGAPELAKADVTADLYRVANFVARTASTPVVATDNENEENDQYARSRYTESMQMGNVLNQDPSPNMRAMVTFVEPTKVSVSFGAVVVCEVEALNAASSGSFAADTTKVDPSCTTITIKGDTWSVVLPTNVPSWFTMDYENIAYDAFPSFDVATMRRATVAESIAAGISAGDQKLGLTTYNKGMCTSNFLKITVPALNTDPTTTDAVIFTINQTPVREPTLEGIDVNLNNRRRLLAACTAGFEKRLLRVGTAITTACDCGNMCGQDQASCATKNGGTWNTVDILERVCNAKQDDYDPTGAIVGGVLGGFFGLLLIGLLVWYLCCRKPVPEPVGRAVAMVDKPLAPVYLPQPYPSLPEQYMPAPMPAYPGMELVQPTGQPTLYSSYQGAPGMEAYPSQPGAYPAPYGVVPQPASYGMAPQQPMYGQPAYGI